MLYVADGECPGLPMELTEVNYVPQAGDFWFTATSKEDSQIAAHFKGTFAKNVVRGQLSYVNPRTGATQPMGEIVLRRVSDKQWVH